MDTQTPANIVHPYLGTVVGLGIALLVATLLLLTGSLSTKNALILRGLTHRVWLPTTVALAATGAWIGLSLSAPDPTADWHGHLAHFLLLIAIAAFGWALFAGLGILSDPLMLSNVGVGRDARRYVTQAQVTEKVLRALVVTLTILFMLLTFPGARAPLASLLASAGLISVIAGLAAQTTLGNMIAGIQLAFTDAIRVGDTVVVPGEEQPGQVEEITLTYVSVRIWDGRHLVLPSTKFTNESFENWTRESSSQLAATSLKLDWEAPIAEIRAQMERVVKESPLWDGRSWAMQVSDLEGPYLTLRIVVSAENWAKAWDLRAYVRENIVAWVTANAPWAIPRERLVVEKGPEKSPPIATEELVSRELQAPEFTGSAGGGYATSPTQRLADPDTVLITDITTPDEKMAKVQAESQKQTGRHLFSGTPLAEKLSSLYKGPGKKAYAQRYERRVNNRAKEQSQPELGSDGKPWEPNPELAAQREEASVAKSPEAAKSMSSQAEEETGKKPKPKPEGQEPQ